MSRSDIQTLVTQDDMVLITIPRRFYDLVIQTLAEAMRAGGSGGERLLGQELLPAVPILSQEETYRGWRREDVRRLKRETDNPVLKALMDLAEARESQAVGIAELEEVAGKANWQQVVGDLRRLTKFAKKELGLDTWPFLTEDYGPDGRAQYRVPENVRRWWAEA